METVLQQNRECFVCGTTLNLHSHHCIYGTSNRKKSEQYGLKVWLCAYHHNMSDESVHFNKPLDLKLKTMAQEYFEKHYGDRNEFIRLYGRNYLD